jgi:FKBP-type peptidyl-prolyl cis-trans isomerase
MKRKLFIGLIGLCLGITSCLDDDELEKQRNQEVTDLKAYLSTKGITYIGMDSLYRIYADTSGRDSTSVFAGTDDYLLVNYNLRLLSDNSLVETNNFTLASKYSLDPVVTIKGPVMLSMKTPPLAGIYYGLIKMKEKDSAVYILPSNIALGAYESATGLITSYSTLIYEVKLVKVINDLIEYDKSFWNRWVVDSMKLTLADTTEEGIYLKKLREGSEAITTLIEDGDAVKIAYRGWLADGRAFSSGFDTVSVTIGSDNMITGFENALLHLKQNARAWVFIPYNYAYGADGNATSSQILIPKYTSLFYEIIVVDDGSSDDK